MDNKPQYLRFIIAIVSWLGFIGLALLVGFALKTSLVLITIAFLIAYILNPTVSYLENRFSKARRSIISVIICLITLVIIILVPVVLLPFLVEQIKTFISHLPELTNTINNNILRSINAKFNTHFVFTPGWLKSTAIANLVNTKVDLATVAPIAKGGLSAINGIISIVLLPFVLFYIIKDWHKILQFGERLIPRRYKTSVLNVLRDIDKSLSYYLRGQVMVMLVMAIVYAVGLNIVGLPAATIIGAITGILVFIPYLGFFVGVFLALLMLFSNFEGIWQIVKVLIALGIGNLIENFIATPFLVGDSIGLNPVMIIFALVICGNLFGIVGVIASLPLTAIGVVLIRHLHNYYLKSEYYMKQD